MLWVLQCWWELHSYCGLYWYFACHTRPPRLWSSVFFLSHPTKQWCQDAPCLLLKHLMKTFLTYWLFCILALLQHLRLSIGMSDVLEEANSIPCSNLFMLCENLSSIPSHWPTPLSTLNQLWESIFKPLPLTYAAIVSCLNCCTSQSPHPHSHVITTALLPCDNTCFVWLLWECLPVILSGRDVWILPTLGVWCPCIVC